MAVFWNVILPFLGFLLTCVECFERNITTRGLNCATGNACSCYTKSCRTVLCSNIDTEEEVGCARQNLRELRANVSFIHLGFWKSDLEFIPDDFLESHPLTSLSFFDNSITKIPRSFIAPVCGTLRELVIYFNRELRSIGEKAFRECEGLESLSLSFNGIVEVSPKAFLGLSNLETLYLKDNNITAFDGLEGIPQLKTLSLILNGVRYLPKNAFQNLRNLQSIYLGWNKLTTLEETFDRLTNLTSIYLPENPLNCDCSLKWLHDWSNTHKVYTDATCPPDEIPLSRGEIYLKDKNMSHCPPTKKSTEVDAKNPASVNSIEDIVLVLTHALAYFVNLLNSLS